MKKVLVLGAGGFIGSHLVESLINANKYETTSVDINSEKLEELDVSYKYVKLDLTKDKEAISDLISTHDIIVNLIAIANPGMYVKDPLMTFRLDFMENLWVVDQCVKYNKRLIQFSTSEVYGKSPSIYNSENSYIFDEDHSHFILGPIQKNRWIYSCAKQMLERVIHAYGLEDKLKYTIIRPFNYIGPRIDFLPSEEDGIPRVFSFFMDALLYKKTMYLVNGGHQKRCYTDIRDATRAHIRIIETDDEKTQNQIINIGVRENEVSIKELAEKMVEKWIHVFDGSPPKMEEVSGETFYGPGYDDSDRRIPAVDKITNLGWIPKYSIDDILDYTMEYYYDKSTQQIL